MVSVTILAAGIGILSALVALALLKLIGLFTNLFFYGGWDTDLVSPAGNLLGFFLLASRPVVTRPDEPLRPSLTAWPGRACPASRSWIARPHHGLSAWSRCEICSARGNETCKRSGTGSASCGHTCCFEGERPRMGTGRSRPIA